MRGTRHQSQPKITDVTLAWEDDVFSMSFMDISGGLVPTQEEEIIAEIINREDKIKKVAKKKKAVKKLGQKKAKL